MPPSLFGMMTVCALTLTYIHSYYTAKHWTRRDGKVNGVEESNRKEEKTEMSKGDINNIYKIPSVWGRVGCTVADVTNKNRKIVGQLLFTRKTWGSLRCLLTDSNHKSSSLTTPGLPHWPLQPRPQWGCLWGNNTVLIQYTPKFTVILRITYVFSMTSALTV